MPRSERGQGCPPPGTDAGRTELVKTGRGTTRRIGKPPLCCNRVQNRSKKERVQHKVRSFGFAVSGARPHNPTRVGGMDAAGYWRASGKQPAECRGAVGATQPDREVRAFRLRRGAGQRASRRGSDGGGNKTAKTGGGGTNKRHPRAEKAPCRRRRAGPRSGTARA